MDSRHVAEQFYDAFKERNAEAMIQCYAPNIHFSDPVFPDLHGKQAGDMWRMLCERSPELRVEYRIFEKTDTAARVAWDAWYPFSKTGRQVHNQIVAEMLIDQGKIVRHVDAFSFWRWARQAFGVPGALLGWTPFFHKKVQAEAAQSLARFSKKK